MFMHTLTCTLKRQLKRSWPDSDSRLLLHYQQLLNCQMWSQLHTTCVKNKTVFNS